MNNSRCCICGEICSGKMRIEARKGIDYIFCTFHFNYYLETPLNEIRRAIKNNKLLLKN